MKRILISSFLAAAAWAQDDIRGPVPGFLFDEHSKALRPIIGIPGASYLGGAIASEIESAAVAPSGRLALAVRDSKLGWMDLSAAELRFTELAAAGNVRIAWNPASSSAAVWHGDGRLELWSHFAEGARSVSLGHLDGVTVLALSAKGVAAAATSEGIYRLVEGESPERIAAISDVSALALDSTGNALYVSSRSGNSALELAGWQTSGAATLLANENAGIEAPAGIALSADERSVIVAGKSSLVVIDRATRAVQRTLALDFEPTRLEPVAGGRMWRLNSREQGQPLEVLSAGPEGKVFFVPVEE